MLSKRYPFYTYCFGQMGRTLATARQTGFFQWFHLVPTEQTMEQPGQLTRFRPEGETFHDLCFLDVLEDSSGALVQMELVVLRTFIEGRNGIFAQDLVKSFLVAALPDACQHVLTDLMREFNSRTASMETPGFLVFAGRRDTWSTRTGWSRLSFENVALNDQQAFVLSVCPNPRAPNATFIGGKPSHCMRKIIGSLGMTLCLSLCACHKPAEPEWSLKGTWNGTAGQITNCGNAVSVTLEQLDFIVQDAPLLNRTVSAFDLQKADVTGTVTMMLYMEKARPITVDSGLLVGEIVKSGSGQPRLQGYVLSEAQYGAWIAKNKQSPPPPDAGEVDLEITGDATTGYALVGEIRASEACGKFSHLDAVVGNI